MKNQSKVFSLRFFLVEYRGKLQPSLDNLILKKVWGALKNSLKN